MKHCKLCKEGGRRHKFFRRDLNFNSKFTEKSILYNLMGSTAMLKDPKWWPRWQRPVKRNVNLMRLSLLPVWCILRQCCWKECFVTDVNNPLGISKNILALEFPEQITLGKWQHLCVRLVDLQGDENWNSNFCVFSFPLPLGPQPSYPIAKERSPLSQLKQLLHLRSHISHLLSSFRP